MDIGVPPYVDTARTQEDTMDLANDPIVAQVSGSESVRALIDGIDSRVVVTDHRLAVANAQRIALNVELRKLRRIQFDIERERPATMVIVPDDPLHEAQVVTVPPEQYDAVGSALAYVGRAIHDAGASRPSMDRSPFA